MFNTIDSRSFQLSSVPPNLQPGSSSRGILVAGSIPMFGGDPELEDEYDDEDQLEEEEESLRREDQMESLGVVSEVSGK